MPWRQQIRLHCTDQRQPLACVRVTAAHLRTISATDADLNFATHRLASAQIPIVQRRY
jgi:hypothetical protein